MNTNGRDGPDEGEEIHTELTADTMAELLRLEGQKIVDISLYGDSIAYEDEEEEVDESERIFFDADIYLADQSLLSLYGASAYTDTEEPPLTGLDAIADALSEIEVDEDILREIGQDQEGGLVITLGTPRKRKLLVAVSGWSVEHWDELPEDIEEEEELLEDEEGLEELGEDWDEEEEEDDWGDDEDEEDEEEEGYGRY